MKKASSRIETSANGPRQESGFTRTFRDFNIQLAGARTWPVVVLICLVALIVGVGSTASEIWQDIITLMLINMIVVVGLYMFIGTSGLFSFGHIGFMAIGAYTSAVLTMAPERKSILLPDLPEFIAASHLSVTTAALVAGLSATVIAGIVSIPIMRLSGIAVGIATFAFLVVVQVVTANWTAMTGLGGQVTGIPITTTMFEAFVWAVIAITTAYMFQETRLGLRLRASREDEGAAAAVGVNVARERRIAFTLSAFFVGIGGALFAHRLGSLTPDAFYVNLTVITVAMLVIGGIKSLAGAVIGTVVVSAIAEALRRLEAGVTLDGVHVPARPGLREVGLALIMLGVLAFRPRGITGGKEIRWPFKAPGEYRVMRASSGEPASPRERSATSQAS